MPKKPPDPPIFVCPICRYPLRLCQAFSILQKANGEVVKLDEDEEASAVARSKALFTYHAPICTTCKRTQGACKEKKVAAIVKRFRLTETLGNNPYADVNAVTKALLTEPCEPTNFTGTPVLPKWWREQPKPQEDQK